MLWDGQEGVDPEVRKGRMGEGAGDEAFGDPGGNSVGDVGTVKVSGGCVGSKNAWEGACPARLGTLADGVEGYLA
jgi:hypothetical protein